MAPVLIPSALLLLLFIPGCLCLRLLSARGKIGELSPFEWIFLSVLISALAASWVGLVLAQAGLFSLAAVLAVIATVSAGFFLASPKAALSVPMPTAGGAALVLAFIALAALFYSPPHEYVLGNWDPGTYVNTAARLAREGSISFRDPVLRAIPETDRELFYYTHLLPQRYEGGMAIADTAEAIVSPHFYHLYTVWLALFHSLAGVGLALRANALFALLAVGAVYLAARELAGRRAALLTALLVSLGAFEIWNARFPTSEILTQFLLWSGLFCLFRYQDGDRGTWAFLAGACFAEALLTRLSAVVILAPLLLLFFWRSWGGFRRGDLFFCAPLAAGVVHLAVQDLTVCRPYVERQVEVLRSQGVTPALLLAVAGSAVLSLLLVRLLWRDGRGRLRRLFASGGFRLALGAALLGLLITGYYLRPLFGGSADVRNLQEISWFVYPLAWGRFTFPLGLCLAAAGVLIFIRDGLDEKRGGFLAFFLMISVPFLYQKMIFPSYIWAVRRYVPFVLPALVFFASLALARLSRGGRARALAAALITVALLTTSQARFVRRLLPADLAGTTEFLDRLASGLDNTGLYVVEGSGIAAPLDYVYGLDVLQLSAQTPEKCRGVERVMARFIEEGRPVYYISRGGRPISHALEFAPLFEIPFETDYLERSPRRFPRRRSPVQIVSRVFRVEPLPASPEGGSGSRLIDVGEDSFGLLNGFHRLERRWRTEGGRKLQEWCRWTGGEAELLIPTFGSDRDLRLTLRASAGAGRAGAPVPVEILVDGKKAAVVRIGASLEDHEFTLPSLLLPAGRKRAVLGISSPTWDPAERGLDGYPAGLGILVDRLLVERVDG